MPKLLNKKDRVSYFETPSLGLCSAEFEASEPDTIVKSALVMVEGDHIDSSKRHHNFSADRIQRIVDRTNAWLSKGGRVPWQRDHKKTQDANIGDLEGNLEARVITAEDLPNPRLKHLIGRIGAFANQLVGKGADIVQEVAAGRIKTLSPGIDIKDDIIKEISATPTPAIMGLSTFALTMDEAEMEMEGDNAAKAQFEEMGEVFWTVINSIFNATEEDLQGQDPQQLLMQALQDYGDRVAQMLQIGSEEEQMYDPNQMQQQGVMPQGAPMPNYLPQQQGMVRMKRSAEVLAAFSMEDMEKIDRAEFLSFRNPFAPPPPPQKKRSLVGSAVKGALAVGGAAAAIRYGGSGLKAGLSGARQAGNIALKQKGIKGGFGSIRGVVRRANAAGATGVKTAIGSGFGRGAITGARTKLGQDIGRIGRAIGGGNTTGLRAGVGSAIQRAGRGVKGSTKARAKAFVDSGKTVFGGQRRATTMTSAPKAPSTKSKKKKGFGFATL